MKRNYLWCAILLFASVCQASESHNARAVLEEAKQLRARADAGDADAMLSLAILLMEHAPTQKRPMKVCDGKPVNPLIKPPAGAKCVTVVDEANAAAVKEWQAVGTKFSAASWIQRAAEHGNRKAMQILCDLGQDESAPADLREQDVDWCQRAQAGER